MRLETLVATMNQEDFSLIERMNIQSDAIIINQWDRNKISEFNVDNKHIKFLSLKERGVGLSRNTALMRSTADIVVFADDDMIYVKDYQELIIKEFEKNPKADIILFSLESLNKDRPLLRINKEGRVSRREALKYGCARVAARREVLHKKNIYFSLLFGGGAKYSCGEDTIFLQDCLKKGLCIYKSTIKIANVKQDTSTWFNGYNEKYYFDKGVLIATIMPQLCWIYATVTIIKEWKKNKINKTKLMYIYKGIEHKKTIN